MNAMTVSDRLSSTGLGKSGKYRSKPARVVGCWTRRGVEPRLVDLMEDPLTLAVMRRDGLNSDDVWRVIRDAQSRLGTRTAHRGPFAMNASSHAGG